MSCRESQHSSAVNAEVHPHPSGAIHPVVRNVAAGIDGERFALWPIKQDGSYYVDADLPTQIYEWRCGSPTDGNFPIKYLPGSCRGAESSY